MNFEFYHTESRSTLNRIVSPFRRLLRRVQRPYFFRLRDILAQLHRQQNEYQQLQVQGQLLHSALLLQQQDDLLQHKNTLLQYQDALQQQQSDFLQQRSQFEDRLLATESRVRRLHELMGEVRDLTCPRQQWEIDALEDRHSRIQASLGELVNHTSPRHHTAIENLSKLVQDMSGSVKYIKAMKQDQMAVTRRLAEIEDQILQVMCGSESATIIPLPSRRLAG